MMTSEQKHRISIEKAYEDLQSRKLQIAGFTKKIGTNKIIQPESLPTMYNVTVHNEMNKSSQEKSPKARHPQIDSIDKKTEQSLQYFVQRSSPAPRLQQQKTIPAIPEVESDRAISLVRSPTPPKRVGMRTLRKSVKKREKAQYIFDMI